MDSEMKYCLLWIPESGLFIRDGHLEDGAGNVISVSSLTLFPTGGTAGRAAEAYVKKIGHGTVLTLPVVIKEAKLVDQT